MKKEIRIPADAETKISKSTILTGNLDLAGSLLVNGRMEGSVTSHDDVYIGRTAVINGDIISKNIYILGVVQGNVKADGHIYLAATAKLFGNISAQSFTVEKGSVFRGACETSEHADETVSNNSGTKSSDVREESVIENL